RSSRRRPFDLMFDDPEMAASIKLYMPWQPLDYAIEAIKADLIELLHHPRHGFFIAGRLDFRDGLSPSGRERKGSTGAQWLVEAVRGAQDGMESRHRMRLRKLVESDIDSSAECLHIDLHPMEWTWGDGTTEFRQPILALGAWSVYKPSSS
ncbi:hypothetical protein L6R49_29185, partial [Myxococcota bacterium]|nr:hypothetical protein [Myxococcota bacterium]